MKYGSGAMKNGALNRALAIEVMGWTAKTSKRGGYIKEAGLTVNVHYWQPAKKIEQALWALERAVPTHDWVISRLEDGYRVYFATGNVGFEGPSLPRVVSEMALCVTQAVRDV